MTSIRIAAVAGQFYSSNPTVLTRDIQVMLETAKKSSDFAYPKAIIVPHAGYIYSGPIAAGAYSLLESRAQQSIHRVILLGPTHRVAVRGLALPGADRFRTPLGDVPVDLDATRLISHLSQVTVSPQAHAQEHSLEVQLPFLQTVLADFKVLPLAVGMATTEEVGEVLDILWGGDETLIVISSDLSHYLPYDLAKKVDEASIKNLMEGRELTHEQACGATPINGLILAARRHHLSPRLLDLRNSGDTAGSREAVVGYAAMAFAAREQK